MRTRRVVFVGSIYPEEVIENLLKTNRHIDFAAQTFESAIITGFKHNGIIPVIISSPVVFPWPKGNIQGYKKSSFKHNGIDAVYVGSCGLPIVNKFVEYFRIRRALKRHLLSAEDSIVVYALHTPFLAAVASIASRCGKICLIVPDLPQYMSANKSVYYKIAKAIDRRIMNRYLKYVDSFVLLSEKMKELLPVGGKPYQIVEGIFEPNDYQFVKENDNEKVIMYSGSLGKANIKTLVEAFQFINDSNCRLWLRGDGKPELLSWIQMRAKEDPRITWFPKMGKKDLLELQHKASFLINPVFPSQRFSKYFFPSKIMEYIASGTPTLIYKLGCIPDEYDDYVYYLTEETPMGLAKELMTYCAMPTDDLKEKGQKGAEFIKNNKTPHKQVQKILTLISE